MELIVFGLLAALALGAAVATVAWSNPLRSAFSLILSLFSLAAIYVSLFAHFLAAMQVLVYAGAVMVLFVFVIMLLDLKPVPPPAKGLVMSVLGGLVVLLMAGKFAKVVVGYPPGGGATAASVDSQFGSVGAVGDMLFRQFLLPFELTSILLLVAVVGAVLVARRRFWREGK